MRDNPNRDTPTLIFRTLHSFTTIPLSQEALVSYAERRVRRQIKGQRFKLRNTGTKLSGRSECYPCAPLIRPRFREKFNEPLGMKFDCDSGRTSHFETSLFALLADEEKELLDAEEEVIGHWRNALQRLECFAPQVLESALGVPCLVCSGELERRNGARERATARTQVHRERTLCAD